MLLDAAVSLACQPAAYWTRPAAMREGNPAWAAFLARGPAAFVLVFLAYAVVVAALLLWLSGVLQKVLGMFVLLAHSYGAASWLHTELPERTYWWALIAMFLVQAVIFALYWRLRTCGQPAAHADAASREPSQ